MQSRKSGLYYSVSGFRLRLDKPGLIRRDAIASMNIMCGMVVQCGTFNDVSPIGSAVRLGVAGLVQEERLVNRIVADLFVILKGAQCSDYHKRDHLR